MNFKNNDKKPKKIVQYPLLLGLVTIVGLFCFFFFSYNSSKYGGNATSDEIASSSYEYYEVGKYYLSDHGYYKEVTQEIWNYMRTLETVMFASFGIMFISNGTFAIISRRKNMQSNEKSQFFR